MSEFEVVTTALQDEARKWFELSDSMQTVATNVGSLYLTESAFWCGDPLSMAVSPIYADYLSFMQDRCREGSTEFNEMGGALQRAAAEYDGADAVSAETFKKIYGDL